MQNLNNKKQNHTSYIAPHTSQKGITLIALIITIIVMLILVGVTINVALNGGLFSKAEEAAEQTQLASEKEQLIMAALGIFDVNTGVDFDNIDLPDGFKEISIDATKAVYEGPSGNKYEVIKETGKVSEFPKDEEENGDDTPPENTIPTIWQERGVTSADVKYDTLYYKGEHMESIDNEVEFDGMTFGLYTNGDICLNFSKDTISSEDANGENNIGENGGKSSVVDNYISGNYIKCFENGITVIIGGSEYYMTFRYTSNNTVKFYIGETSSLDDNGNVPEDEVYFVGTLLPQEM